MRDVKLAALITVVSLMLSLCSCQRNDTAEFYEMSDTVNGLNITVMLAQDTGTTDDEKNKVYLDESELHEIYLSAVTCFSDALTKYTENSNEALAELNGAHKYILDLPQDLLEYYSVARKYSALSGGVYEPISGSLTLLYDKESPTDDEILEALAHCGEDKISIDGTDAVKNDIEASIDFSYLNFGYALERMQEQLESSHVKYGIVMVNGAAVTFGSRKGAYTVNNTVATDRSAYSGSFNLIDGTLYSVGSSDNVIDSSTGKPSETGLREVCVYAKSPLDAVIVAHTIAARGVGVMNELYMGSDVEFEASVVDENGSLVLTPGLEDTENTLFETAPVNTEKTQTQ